MSSNVVLKGLASEAWARSTASYMRSTEFYHIRIRDGNQPKTPYINLFDINHQKVLMTVFNLIYVVVSFSLLLYMKTRKTGWRLRWYRVVYNSLQLILAAYISLSIFNHKLDHGGLLLCNSISNDSGSYRMTNIFTLFCVQKYLECIDTWFLIMRKSSQQVTFLHLFYHSMITIVVGFILPFDYNGDMYFPIMVNSFIHMLIHINYLLLCFGIQSWWSIHLTSLQLGQFLVIFGQNLLSYRIGPTCGSPDFVKVILIIFTSSFLLLFTRFFCERYIFQKPHAVVDIFGVIKRPKTIASVVGTYHGTLVLNANGEGTVILPESFPDPVLALLLSARGHHVNTPFTIMYQLTPLNHPMPNLHIAKGVYRFKDEMLKTESEYPSLLKVPSSAKLKAYDKVSLPTTDSDGLGVTTARLRSASSELRRSTSAGQLGQLPATPLEVVPVEPADAMDGYCSSPDLLYRPAAGRDKAAVQGSMAEVSSHLTQRMPSKKAAKKAVPLYIQRTCCFDIGGGAPLGRVSWSLQTWPVDTSPPLFREEQRLAAVGRGLALRHGPAIG